MALDVATAVSIGSSFSVVALRSVDSETVVCKDVESVPDVAAVETFVSTALGAWG